MDKMADTNSRVLEMAFLMLEGRRTVREVAKILNLQFIKI